MSLKRRLFHFFIIRQETSHRRLLQALRDNHFFTIDLFVDVAVHFTNGFLLLVNIFAGLHNDKPRNQDGQWCRGHRDPGKFDILAKHHPNDPNIEDCLRKQFKDGLVHRIENVIQIRRKQRQNFTILMGIKIFDGHPL